MKVRGFLAILGVIGAGCGETSSAAIPADASPPDAAVPDATVVPVDAYVPQPDAHIPNPFLAPAGEWTWIDVEGTLCADGEITGIGVNLVDATDDVYIYLEGGGACWNNDNCITTPTAFFVAEGFDAEDFNPENAKFSSGPFDRSDDANPFRSLNMVYVPYCTGDFHAGNRVAEYTDGTIHHVGYQNVGVVLERLADTVPDAKRVTLAGTSAGGFGAIYNWGRTQELFPGARVDLIDDSGPFLPPPYLKEALELDWRAAWGLSGTLPAGCADCASKLSALYSYFASSMPGNRGSFITHADDAIIAIYLGISRQQFTIGLGALAAVSQQPNFKHFYRESTGHGLLQGWDALQGDVSVKQFVTDMVTSDPDWDNVDP